MHVFAIEKMRNLKLHFINNTEDQYKKTNHTSMHLAHICTNSW